MLEVGKPFPNFSLPNQDGKTVSLSDFAGKWLVVYFYPKDDTPGCTVQPGDFADSPRESRTSLTACWSELDSNSRATL